MANYAWAFVFFFTLCFYKHKKITIMVHSISLPGGESPDHYYEQRYADIQQSGQAAGELFPKYTKDVLIEPAAWFEALAVCEYAVDTRFDIEQTERFFLDIFRSYDCYVSLDLNEADYKWYWEKIHALFDKMEPLWPIALVEKGLQYLMARRGYDDKEKTLFYLEKAAQRGNELASLLWGYYLYFGFCGKTDKPKGVELMDRAVTQKGKDRTAVYKGYIALEEGRREEVRSLLKMLDREDVDPLIRRQADELQGLLAEREEKYDEAMACYRKALENTVLNFSMFRLGTLLYSHHTEPEVQAEGVKLLEDAFRFGRIDSARILFHCLSDSGKADDRENALYYVKKGYEYNDGYSAYLIGTLYAEGTFSEDGSPDYAEALACYEKAAEMGDVNGYDYAGRYYLTGMGCEEDKEKARMYYEKGCAMGSSYCAVELAFMYSDGNGVEKDEEKTFEYLKMAAEWGYSYAYYLLGRCYKLEVGTEEDPDKAIEYFTKAMEEGEVKAMSELALCYENEYGVEKDFQKAVEYMQAAAEKDYPYAQYKTGCYYMNGSEDFPCDYTQALHWLTKAADNEYPYANLELGDFYLYDYGGKEQPEKAFAYYEKAAREDCVNEGLGLCFEHGIGVEINEGEAFKYYLKAAEDGFVRAMHYAGLAYYYGTGVKENYPEAFRWFNEAASEGYLPSFYYKGKMLLAGDGCMQDIEEGIELLRIAAENEDKYAQYDLGNCYLVGKGVEEDEQQAMEWFEKAADNGHEEALKVTGRRRRR